MSEKNLQYLTSQIDEESLPAKDLAGLFERRTEEYRDKVIYHYLEDGLNETSRITFGEMNRQVKAVAAYLQQKYRKGDRAVMLYPSGINFIVSLFGCFYSGIIGVPAYPPRKNRLFDRFEAIMKDSAPSFILTTEKIKQDLVKNFPEEPVLKGLEIITYEEAIETSGEGWENPGIEPGDTAMLQYTSGSTGMPNGVILTHRNILHNSEFIKQAFGHDENSMGVNWLPGFHDMGLIGALMQPPYLGATNAIIPPATFLMRPQNWLKAIGKFRATTAGGPNFGFDYCVDKVSEEDLAEIDLSTVNPLYTGAEPVRKKTLEQFTRKFSRCGFTIDKFYPCYGMAESVLIVTGVELGDKPLYFNADSKALEKGLVKEGEGNDGTITLVGCGRPWAGTSVAIVDAENRSVLPGGRVGEIWTMGPSVAQGYRNQPGNTKETFEAFLADGRGPWLRTGDLGFIHQGQLFITGRIKDLIIIRGRNHYPQDIELSVQESHEAINKGLVAAFPVEKETGEELVVTAEIKRTHLRDLNAGEVLATIRSALSSVHQLEAAAIVLLRTNSIPITSSGKIQRFECRNQYLEGTLQTVAAWERPAGEKSAVIPDEEFIIAWMKEWIAGKLDIDKDTIDETLPVDKLGLDSVMAVVMAKDAEEEFGMEWPLDLFLEETTLEKIAQKGRELLGAG